MPRCNTYTVFPVFPAVDRRAELGALTAFGDDGIKEMLGKKAPPPLTLLPRHPRLRFITKLNEKSENY